MNINGESSELIMFEKTISNIYQQYNRPMKNSILKDQ